MPSNLIHDWYVSTLTWRTRLLMPLTWIFACLVAFRRLCFKFQLIKSYRLPVPVVVVGNIVVGGTGKTPFVIWLVDFLKSQGLRPGMISRGVGGKKHKRPHWVTAVDSASEIGDEAVLLYQRASCPLVVGVDRVAAAKELLAQSDCNIIISDDGLQHYRLQRDMEIVIIDSDRQFGNGRLLPAGPLREPLSRLLSVAMVIQHGDTDALYHMRLVPESLYSLAEPEKQASLTAFATQEVHAVAGIGHPERFFKQLQAAGLCVKSHPFPDHYAYHAHDFNFQDELPIIMTEKDAVKCYHDADKRFWCLAVKAEVSLAVKEAILNKLGPVVRGVEYVEADTQKNHCC